MISVILLAAGSSRRMGASNKLLLKIGETKVLLKSLSAIRNANVDEIILVTGHENTAIVESIPQKDQLSIVHNEIHKTGMTSSIQCGLRAVSTKADAFMICLADMPLITSDDLNVLVTKWQNLADHKHKILRPIFNKKFGNPVIFSSTYRQAILAHDAPEGCKEIIALNKAQVIPCEMSNDHIFRDIDTPKDYQQFL